MKIHTHILPILLVGLFQTGLTCAQEPSAPKQDIELQLLKKQMLEMQATIDQMRAQHQQEIAALQAQIDAQKSVGAPPLPVKGAESLLSKIGRAHV